MKAFAIYLCPLFPNREDPRSDFACCCYAPGEVDEQTGPKVLLYRTAYDAFLEIIDCVEQQLESRRQEAESMRNEESYILSMDISVFDGGSIMSGTLIDGVFHPEDDSIEPITMWMWDGE